jgi:hypothetical protein
MDRESFNIIRDINHYSDDEQKRMNALFTRLNGITACIHKLSISDCPMMRYREIVRHSHVENEVFREISLLQKSNKPWMRVSLGNVALRIKEIISPTKSTASSANIHQMMLDVKASYRNLNYHISSTVDEMISIGNFNLNAITSEVSEWKKTKPKSITEHWKTTLNEMQSLQRLKFRIDELHLFVGDSGKIKNVADFQFGKPVKVKQFVNIETALCLFNFCNFPSACKNMKEVHFLMESIQVEIQDMIDEFTAWKILCCSMALHPRLGGNSVLRSLGCDLMRMVFRELEN